MSAPAVIRWDQAYNRNGDPKLPRAVVNVIRTYVNNHTLTGWVKAETLATATGLSVRHVRRHIAANVEAGWLEVPQSGNSSGRANTYRLTTPKSDTDVPVSASKGDTDVTQRVTRMSSKDVTDVTPTTPRTSPRSSPTTTSEKGDIDVTIADPGGVGSDLSSIEITTESKGVVDVTLAGSGAFDAPPDFSPWDPPKRQPVTTGPDWGDPFAN